MVRCSGLLTLPSRSWTCNVTTIGTSPPDTEPPARNAHVVVGVNAGVSSGMLNVSSLPATVNFQRYWDTNPVDREASNTQSTAPAADVTAHASSPTDGEWTLNCGWTSGGITVSVVLTATPR